MLLPCTLPLPLGEREAAGFEYFQKTSPPDSCKAAPQILTEQPVCDSLGSRHWGSCQSVWKADGVADLGSVLGRLAQLPRADCASFPSSASSHTGSWTSAIVGGSTPQNSSDAPSQWFSLSFRKLVGKHAPTSHYIYSPGRKRREK